MSICLLWNCRSLLLTTSVIYPVHSCCPSVRLFSIRIVLLTSFLFVDPFLFHTTCSHLVSPAFPHFASSHSWECTEKLKNKLVTAGTVGQDQGCPETFPFLSHPFLSTSLLSLLYPGIYFPHTVLFLPILHLLPILCHHFKERDRHPTVSSVPARIGCWEGELGKVARGSETCASKVPLARQMTSVADSECPASPRFYVGRGQLGRMHIQMFEIKIIFPVLLCGHRSQQR